MHACLLTEQVGPEMEAQPKPVVYGGAASPTTCAIGYHADVPTIPQSAPTASAP